jgi:phosphate transport system permease protein
MANNKSYTGRQRSRQTPKSVARAESLARTMITAGGIGTIVAVVLIFVFLVWVVFPLFVPASSEVAATFPHSTNKVGNVLATAVDEYQMSAWTLADDGKLRVISLRDGSVITEKSVFPADMKPTASAFPAAGKDIALGFADGTVRVGAIEFEVGFEDMDSAPTELADLEVGEIRAYKTSMVERTPEDQLRFVSVSAHLEEPIKAIDEPITLLDMSRAPQGRAFAVMSAKGDLGTYLESVRTDMMTGEEIVELERIPLRYEAPPGRGQPKLLRLSGIGNIAYLLWEDGFTIRFDARDAEHAEAAETFDVTGGDARVTAARFLVGKSTLLVGDSSGKVTAWFPTKPRKVQTIDGTVMAHARSFEGPDAAVVALSPSPNERIAAVGYADGTVSVFHATTGTAIADGRFEGTIAAVALAPRSDGVIGFGPAGMRRWALDIGHPDATLQALFGRVWYESYPEPEFVWQSTGGTDDFESKIGLVPLIFGTLKATIYSMLIAVPIALLAAVFTSEFLSPRLKTPIKSTIEMMASLPSVVLGFLAALVIAPFVQNVLPATLAAFVTVPLALVVGARLWQLLPQKLFLKWSGFQRLFTIAVAFPLGIFFAALLGPGLESVFFLGDIKGWLDGRVGGVGTGWTFILLPFCAILAALLVSRYLGDRIREMSHGWDKKQCAALDIVRMLGVLLLGFAMAGVLGLLLGSMGIDPRGSVLGVEPGSFTAVGVVGTYAQRNAMIVGFVMGFAIVPIIYTLAEDALSSVPQQLREGSLGAGATPWQTATRIIIPTATSGLFGATMVGLGRAVGETMIVLMAAGNTPILEWNAFNGFRTLSATLAVELPEAVRDSTHYRTLFLAALVLFGMTFIINTGAELVRRRFRARYAEQL